MSILSNNPYLSDPDVLLMLAFQKGDKASFEKLMVKHYTAVLNFAHRFLGVRQAAEDLTQEVFIKVYHSALSYKPQSKFKTWLFTITKNLCLNEIRRLKTASSVSLDSAIEDDDGHSMPMQMAADTETPLEEMLQSEKAAAVKEAIMSLPENQRTAVLLKRYEDFSYEEIAKALNCSVEAVKSLLSRAKENLKEKLKNID